MCAVDLKISNLGKLQKLLFDARNEWYNLGLALDVSPHVLEEIEKRFSSARDCYTAMLKEWLKMIDPKPSWEGLLQALLQFTVGRRDLAVKIASEHDLSLPGIKFRGVVGVH